MLRRLRGAGSQRRLLAELGLPLSLRGTLSRLLAGRYSLVSLDKLNVFRRALGLPVIEVRTSLRLKTSAPGLKPGKKLLDQPTSALAAAIRGRRDYP